MNSSHTLIFGVLTGVCVCVSRAGLCYCVSNCIFSLFISVLDHPLSSILHPLSSILYPLSSILHPSILTPVDPPSFNPFTLSLSARFPDTHSQLTTTFGCTDFNDCLPFREPTRLLNYLADATRFPNANANPSGLIRPTSGLRPPGFLPVCVLG